MSMRIRYYGRMGERTGFARAAEHYVSALHKAGAAMEERSLATGAFTGDFVEREVDAVIVHALPLDCPRILERLTIEGNPALIAYTTWEALTMNESISDALCDAFDEVWTPSEASRKAMLGKAQLDKVHVIPHCLPTGDFLRELHPKRNPEGRFRFYWIGAWNARKNPGGLIRAFAHEFTRADDVELYLHSHGTPVEAIVAELAATGLSREEMPPIVLNNDYLDDATMKNLHARGDCFVTAARGEAWNLPCFEALVQRKLIVSTENLGSDDYLVDTSARRVNARRAPAWNTLSRSISAAGQVGAVVLGAQGLTARDLWLEPDLVMLGRAMRNTYGDWITGQRETRIHYDLNGRYGYAAVAKKILTRLENLCQ
jgi:glycosyltransferase involved in cell wall biosynthesis